MTENELKNASFLEKMKKYNDECRRGLIKEYCSSVAECDDNDFDTNIIFLLGMIEAYRETSRVIRKIENTL